MAEAPSLAGKLCDLGAEAGEAWERRATSNLLIREGLKARAAQLKTELVGSRPSPIEALIADRIVLCWLQLSLYEIHEARAEDRTLTLAAFAMKRLESLQRRYLRAIRTLADVRRLRLPNVQVNVGANQVNVVKSGGDE